MSVHANELWLDEHKKNQTFFFILALSGCSDLKVKALGGGSHDLIFLAGLWIKMVEKHLYELNYYVESLLNIRQTQLLASAAASQLYNFKASYHVKISISKIMIQSSHEKIHAMFPFDSYWVWDLQIILLLNLKRYNLT